MITNEHRKEHAKKENLYEFSFSMLAQPELPCDSALHRHDVPQDTVSNPQDT